MAPQKYTSSGLGGQGGSTWALVSPGEYVVPNTTAAANALMAVKSNLNYGYGPQMPEPFNPVLFSMLASMGVFDASVIRFTEKFVEVISFECRFQNKKISCKYAIDSVVLQTAYDPNVVLRESLSRVVAKVMRKLLSLDPLIATHPDWDALAHGKVPT
jgi:hypothetical protein